MPRSTVDKNVNVLRASDTEVMIARRTCERMLFELLAVNNGCTLWALCPESIGHLTELLLGGDVFILSEEPSHVQKYAIGCAWRGGLPADKDLSSAGPRPADVGSGR